MFTVVQCTATECYRRDRVLTVVGMALLVGILPMLALATLDERTIANVNPWIKPIKFSVSLGVYFLTLGWLLSYLPGPSRAQRLISWITAGALLFELPILLLQSTRGVASHFNTTTLLDGALYHVMGAAAFTQMGMLAWALVLFCKSKVDLPLLYLSGIRLGMALTLMCVLPGIMMVALARHAVGVADGGPGLPFLNWSTVGGDLRIAHFLCLHALQVLPLTGFLLSRLSAVIGSQPSRLAFGFISMAYVALLVYVFGLALAGTPLIMRSSAATWTFRGSAIPLAEKYHDQCFENGVHV